MANQKLSEGIEYNADGFVYTSDNAYPGSGQTQATGDNAGTDRIELTQAAATDSAAAGGDFIVALGARDGIGGLSSFSVAREQTPGGTLPVAFSVEPGVDATHPTVLSNPGGGGISISGLAPTSDVWVRGGNNGSTGSNTIGFTTNHSMTVISNNQPVANFSAGAAPVANFFALASAGAGGTPIVTVTGSDTDVGIFFSLKGKGAFRPTGLSQPMIVVGPMTNFPTTIADKPLGGDIGTAAATVNRTSAFILQQSTAEQTLGIPIPTFTLATGQQITVTHAGSADVTLGGSTLSMDVLLPAGKSTRLMFNAGDSKWYPQQTGDSLPTNLVHMGGDAGTFTVGTSTGDDFGIITNGTNAMVFPANNGGHWLVARNGTGTGDTEPFFGVDGIDSDIDLNIRPKGSGVLYMNSALQSSVMTGPECAEAGLFPDNSGGYIGADAATTVDRYRTMFVSVTDPGNDFLLKNPTNSVAATTSREVTVLNYGNIPFTMYGVPLLPQSSWKFIWDAGNSAWRPATFASYPLNHVVSSPLTGATFASINNYYPVDPTGGDFNVTLPGNGLPVNGMTVSFKNITSDGAHTVTVVNSDGPYTDGQTNYAMTGAYFEYTFIAYYNGGTPIWMVRKGTP